MKFQEELISIKEEIRDLKQGNKVASTVRCYRFRKLFTFPLPESGMAETYRIQIKYASTNQPVISSISDISQYAFDSGGLYSTNAAEMMKSPVRNNSQYAWCTVWNISGDDPTPNKVYITVNSTAEVEDIVLDLEQ